MKYPHIINKVCREFWVATDGTLDAMANLLASREFGGDRHTTMEDDDGGRKERYPGYFEIANIAVIPVHGILGKHLSGLEMMCGGCSMDEVAAMIDVADKSAHIQKVFFDFNTPGGTVTGTPELARKILDLGTRKKTYAFSDSACCSGGLWLASQCQHFMVTQSSEIGSVGVRMILMDYTKALEMEGIKVNAISSGRYKLTGAYFKPLERDEYDMLKAESDRIHEQFKQAVTSHRKIPAEHMEGQVYRGEIAVQFGFADGLVESKEEALELTRGDI